MLEEKIIEWQSQGLFGEALDNKVKQWQADNPTPVETEEDKPIGTEVLDEVVIGDKPKETKIASTEVDTLESPTPFTYTELEEVSTEADRLINKATSYAVKDFPNKRKIIRALKRNDTEFINNLKNTINEGIDLSIRSADVYNDLFVPSVDEDGNEIKDLKNATLKLYEYNENELSAIKKAGFQLDEDFEAENKTEDLKRKIDILKLTAKSDNLNEEEKNALNKKIKELERIVPDYDKKRKQIHDAQGPGFFSKDTVYRTVNTISTITSGLLRGDSFANKIAARAFYPDQLDEIEKRYAGDASAEAKAINDLIANSKLGTIENIFSALAQPGYEPFKLAFEKYSGKEVGDYAIDIADNIDNHIDQLDEKIFKYEMGVSESISKAVSDGDFTGLGRALSRTTKEAVASLPYMAVSTMGIPGLAVIGISTAAGGEFDENTDASDAYKELINLSVTDPNYVEKKKQLEDRIKAGEISVKNLTHHTVVGAANSILERFSGRIGNKLYSALKGQSKEAIERTLKDYAIDLLADSGGEGLTEAMQTAIEKASNALIQGKEVDWNKAWVEILDAGIIGSVSGFGVSGTASTTNLASKAIDTKNQNNILKKSNVDNSYELFDKDDITSEGQIQFTQIAGAKKRLEQELQSKTKSGKITVEKSNSIKEKFIQTQQAVNLLKPFGLSTNVRATGLMLEKERLEKAIKDLEKVSPEAAVKLKEKLEFINLKLAESIKQAEIERANTVGMSILPTGAQEGDMDINEGEMDLTEQSAEDLIAEFEAEQKGKKLSELTKDYKEGDSKNINKLKKQYQAVGRDALQRWAGKRGVPINLSNPEVNQEVTSLLNMQFDSFTRNFDPTKSEASTYMNQIAKRIGPKIVEEATRKGQQVSQDVLQEKGVSLETTSQKDFDSKTEKATGKRDKRYLGSNEKVNKVVGIEARKQIENETGQAILDQVAKGKNTTGIVSAINAMFGDAKARAEKNDVVAGKWNILGDKIGSFKKGYPEFVDNVVDADFISQLPTAYIKQSGLREILGVKKIGKSDKVVVKEDGKKSYSRPDTYLLPGEITPKMVQEVKDYFKKGNQNRLGLFQKMSTEIAMEQLIELKNDDVFMSKLQDALGKDKNAVDFINDLESKMDQRTKEDTTLDVTSKIDKFIENVLEPRIKESGGAAGSGLTPGDIAQALKTALKGYQSLIKKGKPFKEALSRFIKDFIDKLQTQYSLTRNQLRNITDLIKQKLQKAFDFNQKNLRKLIKDFDLKLKGRLKVDSLLTKAGLNKTLDLKTLVLTEEGREKIVDTYRTVVQLLPKGAWLGPKGGNVFTTSGSDYDISRATGTKAENAAFDQLKEDINEMLNDPETKFGDDIPGVDNFSVSGYGTVFKGTQAEIKEKAEAFNDKVGKIHKALWERINKLLRDKDARKKNAPAIATYLKLVANHRGHWHKMGAQIFGYSLNPKGIGGTLFEYEHAMPATEAYIYLLDASLEGRRFSEIYDLVIDDYKVIALDKAENAKLGKAGLARKMTPGWNVFDGQWWQRYFNKLVAKIEGGINPANIVDLNGKPLSEVFDINNKGETKLVELTAAEKKAKNKIIKLAPTITDKQQTTKEIKQTLLNSLKAKVKALNPFKKPKGLSVFDFDDTLAFSDSKVIVTMPEQVQKITGTGNAVKVINTVYKGAVDLIAKNKKIKSISFSSVAEESSRIKLYNRLANKLKKDLGWSLDVFETTGFGKKESEDFTLTKPKKQKNIKTLGSNLNFTEDTVGNFKSSFEINNRTYSVSLDKKGEGDYDLNFSLIGEGKGKTFKITPAEFAESYSTLESEGATFNFDEFNKVVKGRKGPLADLALKRQTKFGSGDIFVLTARPQASAKSIQRFLKGIGLDLPLSNITGLENGTPEAKALWVVDKAADGYNDFYFADDALPNVQAVKDILSQIDVKSKVQLAIADKAKRLDQEMNDLIEDAAGIDATTEVTDVEARLEGKKRDKGFLKRVLRQFKITSSADDFLGLGYKLFGFGEKGTSQQKWYIDNLIKPYDKAEQELISAKVTTANDFSALKKAFPSLKNYGPLKKNNPLNEEIGYKSFTVSQAVRVYLWNKQGMDIPGISKTDIDNLVESVATNFEFQQFADKLQLIQKEGEYPKPSIYWFAGNIKSDILNGLDKTFRKKLLTEWKSNVDIAFSDKNLNKLEAAFGSKYVEAIRDAITRMTSGSNRSTYEGSGSRQVNEMMDWLNGSVAVAMFLNVRSGSLQMLSNVNFINWGDNNIYAAAKAFASKDYVPTVIKLMNSDYLVNRRDGLKINVNEAELAAAANQGGFKGMLNYLLDKGFILTRIFDSLAIATGGATFYMNRTKANLKRVNPATNNLYTQAEAETAAFDDFYSIAEETQQSSNPSKISSQQASLFGRVILAFQNVTMQYNRKAKKMLLDFVNRRRRPGMTQRESDLSNLSGVIYYVAVQNLIFNSLQQALFALAFDDDEEKDKDKVANTINSMMDSLLFGLGFGGAIVSTVKNVARELNFQHNRKTPKYEEAVWNLFDISPVIDQKVRNIRTALRTFSWNRKEIKQRGWSLENPAYLAIAQLISAFGNIPIDRLLRKYNNINQAFDEETRTFERIALMMGWNGWNFGLPYWGRESTIQQELQDEETVKKKFKADVRKAKKDGFTKRIPFTGENSWSEGIPKGFKLGKDYVQIERYDGMIQYYKKP